MKKRGTILIKFFPYEITKANMERPRIAKDKHKMWLENATMEINQIRTYLKECKKNELATRQSNH